MSETVEWTPHESALWRTCEIIRDLVQHGRWPEPVPTAFARQISHDERFIALSEYHRSWFGAPGDGSYRTSTFVAGGFSPLGIVMGAATLGASAAANAARKSAARRAMQPRWMPYDGGHLYVSTHGFYLLPGQGVLTFSFPSLVQADLGGPGVLLSTISMDNGTQQQWAITTVWAELLFVLWARDHCPGHPRLANLGFLPAEFLQRVDYAGVWQSSPLREITTGL